MMEAMLRSFVLHLATPAFAAPMTQLQTRLETLVRTAPGKVGVAVLDLDSGARSEVRGREPAPMASVFKLPTAIAVLRRAQERGLPLSTIVHARWEDRAPPWSPLAPRIPEAGLDVTLDALLEAMISESDNTAADVLLRWIGGPAEVTSAIDRLGLRGIRVDRSERDLAHALWGLPAPAHPEPLEALLAQLRALPDSRRLEAIRLFSSDPRDQASPEALVNMLAALDAGRLLDPVHTHRLLELMRAGRFGLRSLRAGLPADVVLAHKTGTASALGWSVAVNDVGIARGGGRRMAIAVLVTDAHAPVERCEDVIADVARAVWEPIGPDR